MTTADFLDSGFDVALSDSVGERGENRPADAAVVQALLVLAAGVTGRKEYHPGPVDGRPGVGTVGAIESFQRGHCWHPTPDGRVDPGGQTLARLVALQRAAATASTGSFPFRRSSRWDYRTGMRRFGGNRSRGRAHAGCDLYFPEGTDVLAVADGRVVRGPYYFYNGTFALEVDHGGFLARYGEVNPDVFVEAGDRVRRGQVVGRVGHLEGLRLPSDMLHFEMYDQTGSGPLTRTLPSAWHPGGRTFKRRPDLLDPTPFLAAWPLPTDA